MKHISFYELLDIDFINKDTSLILQTLMSKGQLFTKQNEFVNVEEYSLMYLQEVF